jgi:hypothetical protein
MHWRENSQTITIKSVSLAFTHACGYSILDMLPISRFLEQLMHPYDLCRLVRRASPSYMRL